MLAKSLEEFLSDVHDLRCGHNECRHFTLYDQAILVSRTVCAYKQAKVPQDFLLKRISIPDSKNIGFIELTNGPFSGNISIIETYRTVLSDRPYVQLN